VLQALFNGVVSGLIVALPALALALTFSVLRFANFAIGAMLTLSAYVVFSFNALLGLPLLAAAAAGVPVIAAICVALDRLVYRPLRERSSVTLLVASMGIAFLLENLVRLFFGNSPRGFAVEVARPFRIWDLRVNHEQTVSAIVVIVCLVALTVLFRKTRIGRAMRAIADDPNLAAVRGIDRDRVIRWTWIISAAMTAVAGTLIGLDSMIDPQMGWNYIVIVFAAAILGGVGNPMAAVPGALLLGVVEELSTLAIPSVYKTAIAFGVMSMVLLVRPSGLFGRAWLQK
jgi:branched-subunit amino acid ABC-type transport system permease component